MGWEYRKQYELNELMGIPNHPPCENCGKINGGVMGSSSWNHDYLCCSHKCGERLGQRIENGMYPPSRPLLDITLEYEEREKSLRYRIKHLEKQLKLHGYKPVKTPQVKEG